MLSRSLLLICVLLISCGDRAPRGMWSDPTLESSTLTEGVVIGGVVDPTQHVAALIILVSRHVA